MNFIRKIVIIILVFILLVSCGSITESQKVIYKEIEFGSNNDKSIVWYIISEDDERNEITLLSKECILLSKECIYYVRFDENPNFTGEAYVSSLNKWLNEEFYYKYFNDIERKQIIEQENWGHCSLLSSSEYNEFVRDKIEFRDKWWLSDRGEMLKRRYVNFNKIEECKATDLCGVRPIIIIKKISN